MRRRAKSWAPEGEGRSSESSAQRRERRGVLNLADMSLSGDRHSLSSIHYRRERAKSRIRSQNLEHGLWQEWRRVKRGDESRSATLEDSPDPQGEDVCSILLLANTTDQNETKFDTRSILLFVIHRGSAGPIGASADCQWRAGR